jgi:hypothetical protein
LGSDKPVAGSLARDTRYKAPSIRALLTILFDNGVDTQDDMESSILGNVGEFGVRWPREYT